MYAPGKIPRFDSPHCERVSPHRGGSEIPNLISPHSVVDGTERLFNRCVIVPAVKLIEIYGIHSQPG